MEKGKSMKKYCKLPVVVEALQYDGHNGYEIQDWSNHEVVVTNSSILVETLEGVMKANIGDYIIKGVRGEFYPCKPDVFKLTYKEVGDNEKND
jgi:hypothetical protein